MKFVKRTTAPSADNKYYLKAGEGGGYNRALEIDEITHSVLPNCCGLVHGRWMEALGETDYKKFDKLCLGNACSYYNFDDGYARGDIPKLGAIICWSGGADKCGHVAYVEEVEEDGTIITSNSAYGGSRFYTKELKAPDYYFNSKYKFLGFIYPEVDFTLDEPIPEPTPEPKPEPKPTNDLLTLVRKTIRGDFGNGAARVKALGDNYNEVQRQVNLNLRHGLTTWDRIKLF